MRVEITRIYKALHTWTGVVAGMALFIAFYAGGLTLFKDPLARWAAPASPVAAPSSLADAPRLIERTLSAHPAAAKDFQWQLTPGARGTGRLTWQEGGDEHESGGGRRYAAFLEEGGLRIEEVRPARAAAFIDTLHRVVGLPFDNDGTRLVMGGIAVLYLLAVVSGVILVLPTLVKHFFALRRNQGPRRFWLDAHRLIGLASLPFHLAIATTAVVFAFHDGIYGIQDKLIHGGRLKQAWAGGAPPSGPLPPRHPSAMLPPAELLARAQALSPTFEPVCLKYRQVLGPKPVVQVWGQDPRALSPRVHGGFVALDPYRGQVLSADFLPGRQDRANTTVSSFFALHFGTYGGWVGKGLYFLLAMAGAWLFYSGNLLWVESRRRTARAGQGIPVQRRDAGLLASATVGVCLGCVCGISCLLVAARGLNGLAPGLAGSPRAVYYAVFFACVAWAFLRGAALASVDLLRLAALSTLLIPATGLLGLGGSHPAPGVGVELVALAAGLIFAGLAQLTHRRVHAGPADSVWAKAAATPSIV